MSIPAGVSKVVLVGTLPQGEIFNTGFWTAGNVPSTQAAANSLCSAYASLVTTHLVAAFGGYMSTLASFDRVNLYGYTAGGPTAGIQGTAAISGGAGTMSTSYLPLQSAWVATLRTPYPGRSRRGRMYFPITNHALTNWQFTQAETTALTTAVRNFLNAVNGTASSGFVSVVSQVGAGSSSGVTLVTGDSRLDIQRRRANREVELFQSSVAI